MNSYDLTTPKTFSLTRLIFSESYKKSRNQKMNAQKKKNSPEVMKSYDLTALDSDSEDFLPHPPDLFLQENNKLKIERAKKKKN
jgi:hypothetical protein